MTTEGFPFDWLDGVGYIDNALGTKLAGLVSSGNRITLDLPWKPYNDTRMPRLMKNDISGVSVLIDITKMSTANISQGIYVKLQHMGSNL